MSDCYFCEGGNDVLEEHHIVPKRFDGSDDPDNLVKLCPTCHRKLETLYDKRFYDELGVSKDRYEEQQCVIGECTKATTERLPLRNGGEHPVCDGHDKCGVHFCGNDAVALIRIENGGIALVCESHSTCAYGKCNSHQVQVYDNGWNKALCKHHAEKVA